MRITLALFIPFVVGCGNPCKGVYTERDDYGNLKKYNEYSQNGQCLKDSVSLSQWESSSESRLKKGVSCKPQPQFSSRALVSTNNFYGYRDGKVYLELNSSTGEYRRLTLAEGKQGDQVFSRLQGCFYERSGQILLDTVNSASSQYFDPMEIFTYTTTTPSTLEMVRFDDSVDWDYRFCPYLDTPWGFCDLLRNGNEMFFPTLTGAQQASLLAESLLIRRQFNYTVMSDFSNVWSNSQAMRREAAREDYKFAVATLVDTPRYIDQAWADYVRGNRPIMPDITSNRIPPICYPGKRDVTLSDGSSSTIYGEVCYVDGQYVFTQ
jgi:hypothetical protein